MKIIFVCIYVYIYIYVCLYKGTMYPDKTGSSSSGSSIPAATLDGDDIIHETRFHCDIL